MNKYIGRWSNWADMRLDWFPEYPWAKEAAPQDFPTDEQIVFASYGGGSYDGDAMVVYERDGALYEVNGGHCSCYGLEGQWKPDETSREALRMRLGAPFHLGDHEPEARILFAQLFGHAGDPTAD
jgi:hypothetical protein